jgi:hypothetical protein
MTQAEAIKSTGINRGIENNQRSASKPMNNINQLRYKTLQEINAWCYQRASHLSINGHNKAAQALTEEHMESLQSVNAENIMWIKINRHSALIAPTHCVVPDLKESKYHKERQNQKATSCHKRHQIRMKSCNTCSYIANGF